MKLEELSQSTKRFIAAVALSCFLLVGVAGLRFVSNPHQAAPAYSQSADDNGTVVAQTLYQNQGNFWSG